MHYTKLEPKYKYKRYIVGDRMHLTAPIFSQIIVQFAFTHVQPFFFIMLISNRVVSSHFKDFVDFPLF